MCCKYRFVPAPPDGCSETIARIYGYAEDVLSGKTVACAKVRAACARFARDLRASMDEAYPWIFDVKKAERPIVMMERYLVPPKGDYEKMELMPWQCFVEGNI